MSKGRLKEKQILVIIKEPGQAPRVEPLFDNTLEAFQAAVGGKIEVVSCPRAYRPVEGLVVICNEEGRLFDLPYNTTVCGIDFCGAIMIVGVKGEEFASIPGTKMSAALRMLTN